MREVINISLPKELARELEKAVKRGKYASKSEFLRELLREKFEYENLVNDVMVSRKEIRQGKGVELKSLRDLK